jgi:hypothetical protein
MIMFWGPTATGKTALLSYLFLRADSVERDWKIYPTAQSFDQIVQQSKQILDDNLFPVGTKPNADGTGGEQEISYSFYNETSKADYTLQTKDLAGVRSRGIDNKIDDELLDSLAQAEGIVLFLDHTRPGIKTEVTRALDQMFVRRSTKPGQKDDRPLAVCLSKVDQIVKQPRDYKALQDGPEQFVLTYLDPELVRAISKYHSRVKYFPVSSVGLRLSFGSLQKSVFYDERLMLRVTERGTPINIVEPFIWIFEQLQKA